jgi:membrane-associated protease RseP (regulator of RpoE activity)
VDRRYLQFFVISLAIIVGSQALQTWLFPAPPKPVVEEAAAAEGGSGVAEETAESATAAAAKPPIAAADLSIGEPSAAAPRVRRTLGSLDPAAARMLVTLTSRGAAVERIELADEKFHDQDDRSGYLGHLAVEAGDGGCRVGVVGPGTPAARAGLKVGDVITKVNGTPTSDAVALRAAEATPPDLR